ncbi:MAG: 50S ribosomal protein L20 [Patescibacteria group bacterium]|jgi:large subunit ribosomal protein L20|nr:50S ribosomal protein L20 [Patescibacteria group bacterium]
MRVKRGVTAHKRHKKILKLTKGYSKIRRSSYRKANEAVIKALSYQYRDRRNKKRDFRSLWITRISAAAKINETTYSIFIADLKKSNISINRKILSELAVSQPKAFAEIVKASK